MAKKKNKKKNNWNKTITSWVNTNQTLLALIGGIAGGALVSAAVRSEQGQKVFTDLTDSVKELVPAKTTLSAPSKVAKGESAPAGVS
jgi:hypothetical protein